MAKDPDKLAAELQTDGGLLSSVLAEENEFDRRMLWRLGSWGVAAVGAVVVAVMANQSSLTLKRDQVAAIDVARQAQQLQTLAKESHGETRRLASAIETLNTDRDRLYSRVTTLEQSLDSVTGAISRQAVPTVTPSPTAQANPQAAQPAAAPTPAVAPVATTPFAPSDKPATQTAEKPSVMAEKPADKPAAAERKPVAKPQAAVDRTPAAAAPAPEAPPAALPAATTAATNPIIAAMAPTGIDDGKPSMPRPPEPLGVDKSFIGPPAPAVAKPAEPTTPPAAAEQTPAPMAKVAAATPQADAAADAPQAQIQRTEFGVALGTANSVNGLRALWRSLLRSKANAALASLQPIIVITEATNGLGMQLHLVAGPLNDAGTAAKICAGLSLPQRSCDTSIYDGQRLTLKQEDEPAPSKPLQPHRRMVPKRAAAPPPPPQPVAEEKKPEPSGFSSIFRRSSQ